MSGTGTAFYAGAPSGGPAHARVDVGLDLDHAPTVAAPAAHNVVDLAGENGYLFHLELAPDRVMVERLCRLRRGDIEAREVAAAVTPVSRFAHPHHGSRRPMTALKAGGRGHPRAARPPKYG